MNKNANDIVISKSFSLPQMIAHYETHLATITDSASADHIRNLLAVLGDAASDKNDLRLTRLFCAEVAGYIEHKDYADFYNRAGCRRDCLAVSENRIDLRYLDRPPQPKK